MERVFFFQWGSYPGNGSDWTRHQWKAECGFLGYELPLSVGKGLTTLCSMGITNGWGWTIRMIQVFLTFPLLRRMSSKNVFFNWWWNTFENSRVGKGLSSPANMDQHIICWNYDIQGLSNWKLKHFNLYLRKLSTKKGFLRPKNKYKQRRGSITTWTHHKKPQRCGNSCPGPAELWCRAFNGHHSRWHHYCHTYRK